MFGNIGNMMKQMGDLKKQMKELQKLVIEKTSKNGEVTIKCNGELKIIDIRIKDGVDIKHLPNLIKETINGAFDEVKMKSLGQFKGLEGLGIPGL